MRPDPEAEILLPPGGSQYVAILMRSFEAIRPEGKVQFLPTFPRPKYRPGCLTLTTHNPYGQSKLLSGYMSVLQQVFLNLGVSSQKSARRQRSPHRQTSPAF